jgi:putative Ca2+/H+ antiporter (TMEM165/GDT1 family)
VPKIISCSTDGSVPVETFLVSTMVVGLTEIGDKAQILSLMLAARFQRPVPILFVLFPFPTFANHATAGLARTLAIDASLTTNG